MDRTQRFIWAAAASVSAIAIIGLLTVPSTAQVHTQFDLGGWTTSYSRNVSLLMYTGAAVLAAAVLNLALTQDPRPWVRWLAIGVMTLLPIVQLLAVIDAS